MKNKDFNNEWFSPSESPNIKGWKHNSSISHFVEQTHSLQTFYLIAGICQVLLGLTVITVAILGLIQPMWLSTALIMLSSVTTMIGLYLLYITRIKRSDHNFLLRSAMRRVMEHKN